MPLSCIMIPQNCMNVHSTMLTIEATPIKAMNFVSCILCVKFLRYHVMTPQKDIMNQRPYQSAGYCMSIHSSSSHQDIFARNMPTARMSILPVIQ